MNDHSGVYIVIIVFLLLICGWLYFEWQEAEKMVKLSTAFNEYYRQELGRLYEHYLESLSQKSGSEILRELLK